MKPVERIWQTEAPRVTFEDISRAIYLALTTRRTRGPNYPRAPIEREPDNTPETYFDDSDGKIHFSTHDDLMWGNPELEYIEYLVKQARTDAEGRLGSEWQEPERPGRRKVRFGKAHIEQIFAELRRDLLSGGTRTKHLKTLGLRENELELAKQILELNPDFNNPDQKLVELLKRR